MSDRIYRYKAIILVFGVYCLGGILDIWVSVSKYSIILVTESYMDYVFSAVITISVLSFTIIALIGNSLNDKYLGYEIKEILNFNNNIFSIKNYIIFSLSNVIIALIALTIDFIANSANILVSSLVSTIILTLYMGIRICTLLTNDEYCKDMVKQYYISISENISGFSLSQYQKILEKLRGAFDVAIKNNNKEDKEFILKLLCKLNSKIVQSVNYYNYLEYLNNFIRNTIVNFTLSMGYIQTIKDVINIYNSINNKYELLDKILIPIEEIEYYEDKKLRQINYLNQLLDLEWELNSAKIYDLGSDDIRTILYSYFEQVMENKICMSSTKKILVENFFREFTMNYGQATEENITNNQYVLLMILKHYVLINSNAYEREYIYRELLKNVYSNNILTEDNCYFNMLSLMFQAFYCIIELEQKLLTNVFREQIRNLILNPINSVNISGIKLGTIIKNNMEDILKAIAKRIQLSTNTGKMFEYFPNHITAKSLIWTEEYDIEYFFMLYLLDNSEALLYSPYSYLFDWEKLDENKKIKILDVYLRFFDYNTSLINKEKLISCTNIAALLDKQFSISEDKQKKLFEHIINEKSKIYEYSTQNVQVPIFDIDNIIKIFVDTMNIDKIYGWNPQFKCETYIDVNVQERLSRKKYWNEKSATKEIKRAVEKTVNEYINKNSNTLYLSFDKNGTDKLKEFLENNTYNSRNYTFTEDWAFSNSVRESDDFKSIIELNKSVEFIKTPKIQPKMYFNRDKFKFNVILTEYRLIDLSEKECLEYLENSKSYNGKYNVDGSLFTKSEAINIIGKIFCKEKFSFKLLISINKEDITCINFRR